MRGTPEVNAVTSGGGVAVGPDGRRLPVRPPAWQLRRMDEPQPVRDGARRWRWVALAAVFFGGGLRAAPDSSRPWNPSTPLPKFITHVNVDPGYLTAISKYRSVAGHAFSDNYEPPNRSLKNYFEPRRSLLGKAPSIPVYAPATGTLATITPEGSLLASGEPRGYQISLAPDGYPAFEIRLFHVALAPAVRAGLHVNAGDVLGLAHVQEGIDFDWAVGVAWDAPPLYDMNGGNQVPKAPGYRLVSPFDVMTDEAFTDYAPYGVTDRSAFVVPLAYRETHPTAASGGDLSHFDEVEYVTLQPPEGPVIDYPPLNVHTSAGGSALLSVGASFYFGPPLTYQWNKNGVPLGAEVAGSREALFFLSGVKAADMGFYTVTVTGGGISTESPVAILTVDDFTTSRLINVSTRGLVPAGGALTPGFVLRGAGAKPLLIRAVGPTLRSSFGLAGALADSKFELAPLGGAAVVAANDDWVPGNGLDLQGGGLSGAFPLLAGSKDAAASATLAATGNSGFTVRVTAGGAAGVGLAIAEVYDLEPLSAPVRLANVSTLGFAGFGAEALTPGFVIGGTAPKRVLVRAIGPGLAAFNVAGALADPQITLMPLGRNFTVAANNDWGDGGQAAALQTAFAAAGAFALPVGSKDAALVVRLPPGGYTVQVSDSTRTATGNVLVEIYDLDP